MNILKETFLAITLSSLAASNALAVEEVERVSLDATGSAPSSNSHQPSVTYNGRYIAFESDAIDLVAGDTNGFSDIFVYDRQTKTNTLISVPAAGGQGNRHSTFADISDDGRYVVFASSSTNMTADTDTNVNVDTHSPNPGGPAADIFLRDTVNNTTILISKSTAGSQTANAESTKPVISDDGKFIAFESLASDLIVSDFNGNGSDVFRYEIATGIILAASVNNNGVSGNERSHEAAISSDGNLVAFSSNASNFNLPGDVNRDVFLRNFTTANTLAITSGSHFASGLNDSEQPSISADGNTIIFESSRQDLVTGDDNGVQDIYAYDLPSGTYARISVSTAGAQADGRSGHPGVSPDGRYVVFESSATNLDGNDTNGQLDVFVRDLAFNKTSRVSLNASGAEGTNLSHKPKVSGNGRYFVFSSLSQLDIGDSDANEDIYLFERTGHNDFDDDGHSDVLWRNSVSADNRIYLMNGTSITSDTQFVELTDNNWVPVSSGDFNDAGTDDILWRNSVTGATHISFMNGTSSHLSQDITGLSTDLTWKIAGVGDFNNDRYDDILWRNITTGQNKISFMDGPTVLSEQAVAPAADTNWQVAGIGDFNYDKKADILWRHDVNRRVWMYLMDGNTVINGGGAGEHIAFTSENWDIQGVGDFDDNGKSDILWRHNTNGRVWAYLMDGITVANHPAGNPTEPGKHIAFTGLDWNIKAIGDYNGDGQDDIFWRNDTFGWNHMYFMNGVSIINGAGAGEGVNTFSDLTWKVVKGN